MSYRRLLGAVAILLLLTRPVAAQMIDTGAITIQDAGSCATVNACVSFTVGQANAITLQASGTFSATGTIEGTSDGTNWFSLLATNLSTGATTTTITAMGQFAIPNAGLLRVRVRAGTYASGTLTITATRGYLNARLMTPNFTSVTTGTLTLNAASGGAVCTSPADGVMLCTNAAGTDFGRLAFGCTTSACPALKRNGSAIEIRLADDSGRASFIANVGNFQTLVGASTGNVFYIALSPTISSGFGGTPSIPSNNGTAAFRLNVGTGGAATSGVIGLPAATTGWNCFCSDITTQSATVDVCRQTASATNTATIGNFNSSGAAAAWVASDILAVSCFAY